MISRATSRHDLDILHSHAMGHTIVSHTARRVQ